MEQWQRKWITKNLTELVESTELTDSLIAHFRGKIFSKSDCETIKVTGKNEGSVPQAYKFYDLAQSRTGAYDIIAEAFKAHFVTGPANILEEGIRCQREDDSDTPSLTEKLRGHQQTPKQSSNLLSTDNVISPGPIPRGPVSTDAVDGKLVEEFEGILSGVSPLDVVVEPPLIDMQAAFGQLDEYNLPYQDKGVALLVNIKYFANKQFSERHGSENDVKYLRKVFRTFGYNMYREADIDNKGEIWGKNDFTFLVKEFQEFCNRAKPKSIIIFIGSHGSYNKIDMSDPPETKQESWDKPAKYVDVSVSLETDIFSMFDSKNCPGLKGKPKIFLISACQKFQVETDDAELDPPVDDMIILTAQAPGFKSYRDTVTGTWLTHCLTWVLMKHSKELSLQQMLKLVQEIMKTFPKDYLGLEHGQIPVISDRGLGPLYFFMEPK